MMDDKQPDKQHWLQNVLDNTKTTEYALLIPLMAFLTLAVMGIFSYMLYEFFIGIAEQIPDVPVEETIEHPELKSVPAQGK